VMDVNGTETLDVNARGGADTVTVNDLTGTDVSRVNIDLGAGANDVPDGAVDTILINATNGDDAITINNNNGVVTVHMVDEAGVAPGGAINNFHASHKKCIKALAGGQILKPTRLRGLQATPHRAARPAPPSPP